MRRLSKVCRAVSRDIRYRKMDRRTWRAAGRGQARLAYMNGQKMMIWYNINSSLWHFKNLYCFFFTTRSSSVSPPPQASYVLAQLYIFVCTNTHNTAVFGKTKTKQNNPPQKNKKTTLMDSYGVTLYLNVTETYYRFHKQTIHFRVMEGRMKEGLTMHKYPYF